MTQADQIRLKLKLRLSAIADDRSRGCALQRSGQDIKTIDLARRLANQCAGLTDTACLKASVLGDGTGSGRRFEEALSRLSDNLGITIWPTDVNALLQGLITEAEFQPEPGSARPKL